MNTLDIHYFRLPSILHNLGVARSTLYSLIKTGLFVRPIKVSRVSLWPVPEIQLLMAAHAACKSDFEIRELVKQLEVDRKSGAGIWAPNHK